MGLLVRRSGGFSKPNHLYVKIPSDEIGLQTVDDKAVEKIAVIESEKPPSSGRKNGCAEAGNVAPIAVLLISANTTCTKPPSAIICAYSF